MNNNKINNNKKNNNFFLNMISNSETIFIFTLFAVTLIVGIVLAVLFQSGSTVRTDLFFNKLGGIGIAIIFVYIIFNFMGANIKIFNIDIDMGLTIYIVIVLFVLFVLGG